MTELAGAGGRSGAVLARVTLVLLALALLTSVGAQPELVVNGRTIAGNTTSLVSGVSYAPAGPLAGALGGIVAVDAQRGIVAIDTGARLLQVEVYTDATAASAASAALRLDGVVIGGPGALDVGGEVYLPVKQVSEALGGSVTFFDSLGRVVVVQPRARISAIRRQTSPERIEISVSSPVRYSVFHNEPIDSLLVHFERTDIELELPVLDGEQFVIATASSANGGSDVRIQLEPDVGYQVYRLPEGRGYRLVIAFGPVGESALAAGSTVVIDPGHGGDDTGLEFAGIGSESTLTLSFSQRLASELRARGVEVRLTRDTDHHVEVARRSSAGVGADLLISVHAAPLPVGEFNLYYLGDAADVAALEMAIRQNASAAAAAETDRLRRELLLGLVPDLARGRALAEGLGSRLFTLGDYRANELASAPLQALGGAAGRGVLAEFAAADLAAPELPGRLAEALVSLLEQQAVTNR